MITNIPSEQALLTEYEACQHDNSSSSQSYWTLTGIFIGFSSALLGGLIYGVLSSNGLFKALLNVITQQENVEHIEQKQVFAVAIIMILLSVTILLIMWFLKGWLKRVQFLARCNFERMREIENKLGMWKSWRVHGIDNWNNLTDEERNTLGSHQKPEWYQCKRESNKYELPSSKWHYAAIFRTLIILWLLLLMIGLVTICKISYIAIAVTLIVLALIFAITLLYKKCALRSKILE